jgi:parallel beta-helix repeat protein
MNKSLVLGLIFLIGMMSFTSISGNQINNQIIKSSIRDDILYVGGNGPNNYTRIQDAIDNASDLDTVFVFDNTSPYYENVVVDKSIKLIGENRNTTVIDGDNKSSVIDINENSDNVTISGFKIQNSVGNTHSYAGVSIRSNFNTIIGNIICSNKLQGIYLGGETQNNIIIDNSIYSNNWFGIRGEYSKNNIITNNDIISNKNGISLLVNSKNNTIRDNNINSNNESGIYLDYSSFNTIAQNIIQENRHAIIFKDSGQNDIQRNLIINNIKGILISGQIRITGNKFNIISHNQIGNNIEYDIYIGVSMLNTVKENNFIGDKCKATFESYLFIGSFNRWQNNYWDDWRGFGPYPVSGTLELLSIEIPWVNFDWHPAKESYDIPENAN